MSQSRVLGKASGDVYYDIALVPTETIMISQGPGSNWSGHINFKTYSTLPFNPSGKPNGWNEYNGEWYYVRNGQCVTGWFQEGSNWYYLEADGKMKKGWLASGNDWFYLSPRSGVMQVNTFVDDDKFHLPAPLVNIANE